ncbi:type II toxin-antitoxin system VapC family toxin [Candidatus Pacearchaeota archaeon]|nr:type II toxin-antitoxin system VapC family toxin [Candidatus Pacearchaeota archaeon]
MVRKICLDSDTIIGLLKNDDKTIAIIASLDADFYITSITLFEIWTGRKDEENISELLAWLDTLEFGKEEALVSADLRRKLRKLGQEIDIRDLFIASICIKNELELFTHNKKHFERFKQFGLKLV